MAATGDNERVPEDSTRRAFLSGAGATALAGLVAACSSDDDAAAEGSGETPAPTPEPANPAQAATPAAEPVAFRSIHQNGVLLAPTSAGIVAAFDVVVGDRAALTTLMQELSGEIERLMNGEPPLDSEGFRPPADAGLIDADSTTAGLAITVGVGSSLFDDRFGLTDRTPRELIPMPVFFNDRLVRPELSHGDIVFTVTGPSHQATTHALHQIVRLTDRRLRLRWVQEGYNDLLPPAPDRVAPTRNLMGFRDGTSNLDTADDAAMRDHVWIGDDDGEPDWAVGGTYQAVRIIRMLIEFWATAALVRQEQIFGRHRDTGAPLGQALESDEPIFAADRTDEGVPRRSHIRLANPRIPETGRILRRGFSYRNGVDVTSATLDQGLLFVAYQRSLRTGFLAAQARLDGEPLEDYVKPVGGGLFLVLPGPGTDGWLGERLLT